MFTLDEALSAIQDRKEFQTNRYDGLVSVNYVVQLPDSFEGIRREFRGVTFSEKTGEIVSLPLHKFLNINQAPETQWHLLQTLEGEIFEKLDGSMIHFLEWSGEIRASTRMSSNTDQAQQALRLATKLGLLTDIQNEIRSGWTPIFEYVAPHNQIVVEYPRPRLVYLHSRERATGQYRSNPVFEDRARKFAFRFADILGHLEGEEFEGYVACLSNGLWVKCKCPWYLERHRAVDALMKPAYLLYELVYLGVMDDLIAGAPDRHKPKLQAIYTEAQLDYLNEKARIEALSQRLRSGLAATEPTSRRKEYVMAIRNGHDADFSLLMTAYDGKNLEKGIQNRLLDGYKAKYPHRIFSDPDPEG